jgi:hypothetical protein
MTCVSQLTRQAVFVCDDINGVGSQRDCLDQPWGFALRAAAPALPTRLPGQIDPGVLLYLIGQKGMSAAEVQQLFYHVPWLSLDRIARHDWGTQTSRGAARAGPCS